MVGHEILLQRVQTSFGIDDTVLGWFRSYLVGWIQFVRRGSTSPPAARLVCGVPHGSVLGPVALYYAFSYTDDLAALVNGHGLSSHLYADDTQIYGACSTSGVGAFLSKLSDCVSYVGVISPVMDAVQSTPTQPSQDRVHVLYNQSMPTSSPSQRPNEWISIGRSS
jgi:hypothetical protein